MNFAKSIINALLNEGKADAAVTAERLEICSTCPKRDGDKCTVCGCFIELKAGMDKNKNPKRGFRVEKTHCPLGKWPYIDEAGYYQESDKEVANYYREMDGIKLLK